MAILGDLLVQGRSRFLQKIYAASLDIGEDTTIAGTLTLSKTNDAIGTSNNSPALVVGGTATTAHLELDSNEIIAKTNSTTAADIYVNPDGGVIYLGKSGIKTQIQGNLQVQGTSTFTGASTHSGNLTVSGTTSLGGTSVSSDLNVANNAKVNGILTVEEEIRSPKWIVDNIANLGGEFIIAPTIVCENNTSVNISGPSNNLYTITVTDGSITSNTFGGIAWSTGSVVKVSGTINDTVLVSINGTMTRALNQTTGTIQFTVSSNNITLTAGTYTGTKVKNLHIMMYKVGNIAPVGIFMTSYGQSHYPYIDIYSGTTSGSFYSPTTRLGYLNGLTDENGNALKINNISPTGWGLYTSNGYFSGTIVSTNGKIGGFNLDTTKIYSGTNSISSTTVGVYLGIDGIRNYNSASQSVTIKNGVITAIGADVSGKITATSGEIGGFTIDSSSIHTKNVAVTSNADNSISLSSIDFTRTINSTSRAGLRFAIGDKFGITGDGVLYTNGANITNINANNISTGTVSVGVLPESVKNENIEIGGRNLLYKRTSAGGRTTVNGDYSIILNASENSDTYFTLYTRTQLVEGTTYVISCEASGINGEGVYYNFPLFRQGSTINGLIINKNGINSFSFVMNDTELEYHVASTVDGLTVYRIMMDDQGRNIEGQTGPITLTNFKLEKGNIVTDWTPAPEDQEALITNTRTWYATCSTAAATTAKEATTTDSGFVLKEGVVVDVKFTNTNTGAVGSLTLNVNGTGAKSIKTVYNDSLRDIINAGQLYANSIIHFVYNGTYWIAETNYNSDNDSNAMYVRYYNTILAGQALQASSIIGGRADGKFYQIKENSSFDLAHPLLWTTGVIPNGGTNFANIYTQCYDVNLGTYYTSFTNTTKNCLVYLVGTVSGNTFTTYGANSASYLTVTPPTTADGRFYIPIGRLGNSSNGKNYFNFQVSTPVALYAYIDGKFRQVTPTDIVATQRIYYRSNSSTKPNGTGLPTTWVTENGNKFNTNATTAAGWSKKVSPMTSDGVTGSGKYIYLWTCEQRKRLDGTIDYTEILLDDSTTIIDGGNIITGTVTANKLDAVTINASKMLTVGSMTDDAKSSILNENISVGGRNFLLNTENPTALKPPKPIGDEITWQGSAGGMLSFTSGVMKFTSSSTSGEHFIRLNSPNHTQRVYESMGIDIHDSLVLSGFVRASMSASDARLTVRAQPSTGASWVNTITLKNLRTGVESTDTSNVVILTGSSSEWIRFEVSIYIPESVSAVNGYFSFQQYGTFTVGDTIEFKRLKLERGIRATDWSPAPEDVNADISSAEVSAKGYADTKKSEAISAAATDATNKANTAKSEAISAAATDATNKANIAETNAKGYADGKASDVYEKIRSQGIQLVTNGNGFLGNNTNWSSFTFDGSKSNASPGSFTRPIGYNIPMSDEMFPIDASKEYLFEFDAISADGTGRLYSMIMMYDVDKTDIGAQHVMYYPNTLTTLAQDLNPGDTTVKLTSTANWSSTTAGTNGNHQRALVFWDYSNSFGYTYLPETYSRNYYGNLYSDDSKVNKATGVISLTSGWAGPKKLAGTPVSQGHSGNTYMYAHANVVIPSTWTHYSYVYSGLDTYKDGIDNNGKFRQGTAFGKVGFLWNYGHSSSAPQGQIWVTNISIKEATATKSQLDSVANTANNAAPKSSAVAEEQYIYRSATSGTTSMSGTTTWVAAPTSITASTQNVWTTKRPEYSSSYPVLFIAKQCKTVSGTVTCTTPQKDDTTTIIDGGHITTGTIDTNRLNADTIKSNIVQTTELNADKITSGTLAATRIAAGSISVGKIDATSGTFNTANIPDLNASKITAGDIAAARIKANVISAINSLTAGQIDAARINASQLTIGQSQVTNLSSSLATKSDKTLPDTRNDNQPPSWYISTYPRQSITEFKFANKIGFTSNVYCTLTTIVPWNDASGGYPTQSTIVSDVKYYRVGTGASTWSDWSAEETAAGAQAKADAKDDAIAAAAKTATTYITHVDNNGITIHPSSTTNNRVAINADGMQIYKGNVDIASYGDTARIGKTNSSRFLMNASSLQAYNSSNKLYFEISSTGIKYGTDLSSTSTTTTVASTTYADNKASDAQTAAINAAASDATNKVNALQIGGRNLLTNIKSNWKNASLTNGIYATTGQQLCPTNGNEGNNFKIEVNPSTTYVLKAYIKSDTYNSIYVGVHTLKNDLTFIADSGWKLCSNNDGYVFTTTSETKYIRMTFRTDPYNASTSAALLNLIGTEALRIKLEKGNKATDWTPASEDVNADIANAATTATNYISTNANGIRIASASPSTQNMRIELTSSAAKLYSSDNIQRLSLDSTTGVVVGNPSKGRVMVNDVGLTIYDTNNHKRSAIDSDGLEVFAGTDSTSVAKFGTSARIGKASDAHVVVKPTYFMETTPSGANLFEVGRILDDDGYADYVDVEKPSEDTSVFALTHRGQTIKGYTYNSQTTEVTINPLTVSVDGAVTSAYTLSAVAEAGGDVVHVTLNTAAVAGSIVQIAYRTTAAAVLSMQFGRNAQATGECSSAFGVGSIASGTGALAEGGYYTVNGDLTDYYNGGTAKGDASHAEGVETIASGVYSHTEGYRTMANKPGSHAEGDRSTASGSTSHAEGFGTKASGTSAHAEGDTTTASNFCAHAEGSRTTASGGDSHAEGYGTTASSWTAHAQNFYTTAGYSHQTTIGKYNSNQSDNAFEIGNGTSESARSNALTVDWDGNLITQGMAGIIQMFAGSTPPTGWLLCHGQAISRTDYATLFAAIGTTWGSGNGSTTFNVPDLRGRAPIGAGTGSGLTARTLAAKGGSENIQAHTHAFTQPTVKTELKFEKNAASGSALNRVAGSNHNNPSTTTTYTATVTGGAVGAVSGATTGSAGNMPPFAVINFIICTGKTS